MLPRSYYLDLSSSRLDADLEILVASGGGGAVYKGTFARKEVALKAVTAAQSDNKTREIAPGFIKEVILWKCIRHPNILPFLGVYQPDGKLNKRYIVSPWMENGEISHYLKSNPKVDRVKLIIDIVHGIKYLHSPDINVVHGDLKPSNILVDEEGRACLADFGLSRMKVALSSVSVTSSPTAYTVRYAAPERVFFYEYDLLSTDLLKESDVFSLAMVMWQIFTDEVPFPKCKYSPAVSALIKGGKRPERLVEKTLERGLSDPIWDIMERCWSGVLEERPSLDEVLKRLPVRGTPRRK
ncbi:kinase-like protein [Wolfiporia cocos MD-104 SS10]|uniref:Kinase-like protein n=1 Tax=Wolfiporia cocos (strain MD-104) TaxID=742152 RepID=A0A2H3JPQ8_WOLCO|nr:kinase-like protein [Wolfiporia cocos MD-104 SS10]